MFGRDESRVDVTLVSQRIVHARPPISDFGCRRLFLTIWWGTTHGPDDERRAGSDRFSWLRQVGQSRHRDNRYCVTRDPHLPS